MSEAKNAVDQPRIEAAVREILLAIGEDPDRDGLQQTPARVARAYAEFFSGLHQDAGEILGTTFDIAHSEMVLVKDLNPRGAIVVIEAEHMCMSMRGVRKPGAKTVTSAVRGALMNTATRAEAMSLIFSQR